MSGVRDRVGTEPEPVPDRLDSGIGTPPAMTPRELARWAWRQLTSMRIALLLLFLLAVAAIPGSVVPQRESNPLAAAAWAERYPAVAESAEALGLFDVYSTPWFSAIYLLLMVSLVGCIVPRARLHWRAGIARPPAPPRHLDRLPVSRTFEVQAKPEDVLVTARRLLRRYRVDRHADIGFGSALAAERGHARETGNLAFHLAVVVILVAVAAGSLFGYRASVLLVTGSGFANSPIQYDGLEAGPLFDLSDLPPFTLTVDDFVMDFRDSAPQVGSPQEFRADVTVIDRPGAPLRQATISVNHPLKIDGTSIHLLNPGYAPRFTIRDGRGRVVFSDLVPFLPQDPNFLSTGVVKVESPTGPDLGLEGVFLPTAALTAEGPQSLFPEPRNPLVVFTVYTGDLGLDDGVTQSVYRLDTSDMTQLQVGDEPFRAALKPGESATLPDAAGSVTFDGYQTWVNLQVGRNAGTSWALGGAVLAIWGLLGSLYVRRRRVWVRVSALVPGRTTVELGGLDRTEGGNLEDELDALVAGILARHARAVTGSVREGSDDPGDFEPGNLDAGSFAPEQHGQDHQGRVDGDRQESGFVDQGRRTRRAASSKGRS